MKTINDFILERKEDISVFPACKSINDVLSKLRDARKKHYEYQKLIPEINKKFNDAHDSNEENAWVNACKYSQEIDKKYKSWGHDIWLQYCGYLNLYNWDELNENDFKKIDSGTEEWNETIENLIYVRKWKKNQQLGLFVNKNNEFKFMIISSAFYDLNFDRDVENNYGYYGRSGCTLIYKYKGGPYSSPTPYSNKDIINILKEYDIYVAKEPTYKYENN